MTDLPTALRNIRNPLKVRRFAVHQGSTMFALGLCCGTYQLSRHMLYEYVEDIPDGANIAGSVLVAFGPLLPSKVFRRSLPWAGLMVAMDVYHGGLGSQNRLTVAQAKKEEAERRRRE